MRGLHFLSTNVAKFIAAEACDVITTQVFLNYHLAVRTPLEPMLSLQQTSHFSIATSFVSNLKTFDAMVFFAEFTFNLFFLYFKHSITIILPAQFNLRIFQHFPISPNLQQFFLISFLQKLIVWWILIEFCQTLLPRTLDNRKIIDTKIDHTYYAPFAIFVLFTAKTKELLSIFFYRTNFTGTILITFKLVFE